MYSHDNDDAHCEETTNLTMYPADLFKTSGTTATIDVYRAPSRAPSSGRVSTTASTVSVATGAGAAEGSEGERTESTAGKEARRYVVWSMMAPGYEI